MLNRRHIRVKVMQTIYAMHQKGTSNLDEEEQFLFSSIENLQDLYLIMVAALVEIKNKEQEYLNIAAKKHLATDEDRNPNTRFVNNIVLNILAKSPSLFEAISKRKITNWKQNDDYIFLLLNAVKNSSIYKNYMSDSGNDFENDLEFIIQLFTQVIAPNDKLYDYLEDNKLTWIDDIPLVNTHILKQLKKLKSEHAVTFLVPPLYKDKEDADFASKLFRKTILNEKDFAKEYEGKTPNWDSDRIAEIDTIILKMAICEFLKFPSIPVKVTINEYLEIAKEYSTPKSSIFINGILDNLVKEYQLSKRLEKTGRGLM